MADNILTLFSSNSTIQYTKDIFSVLSLPRNCHIQFRYQSQYVENSVKAIFENTNLGAGTKVLLAFRSNSKEDTANMFIVPIRWAKIISVKHFSDVYTVSLELLGYPSFSTAFRAKSANYNEINLYANNFLIGEKKNLAAISTCLDLVELEDKIEKDIENWRAIVESLTKIPQYSKCYFLKYSAIYKENYRFGKTKRKECKMVNGRFVLTEEQLVNIDIEYYSSDYSESIKRKIDVDVDGIAVKHVKGLRTIIQSRYGSIALGFQPLKVSNNTISEIILCTSSQPEEKIQTDIVLPVILKTNKKHRIRHAIIMSVGAALVALPGILSNNVDISLNIALGVIGALTLGVNYFLDPKE